MENVSFGLTAAFAMMIVPRPSAVYLNTWPILAAGIGVAAAKLRGAAAVVSVQDLYPESLAAQKRLDARGPVFRLLRAADRLINRAASAVIVISESFRRAYRAGGIADAKIHMVANWIDAESVTPNATGASRIREDSDIPATATLFVYAGNVGAGSGIEAVLNGFVEAGESLDAYLLIAGEGSRMAAVRELASRPASRRVRIRSPWAGSETSEVLAAADVLLLPTQGDQSLASMPSKLMTYLLAQRPVLTVASDGSELARTVAQAGCGWVAEPSNPQALIAALRASASSQVEDRDRMGRSGRAFALAHFTRDVCLPRVTAIMHGVMTPRE